MSTFESNYDMFMKRENTMPAWAKAERYDYCEQPFYGKPVSNKSKRKNSLTRLLLSALS